MECYYHPDRDGTDTCAICGKSICKECGLEIAGKTYCKECLEKIVGLGIENKATEPAKEEVAPEPLKTEPARLNKRPDDDNIYQKQPESEMVAPSAEEVEPAPEIKQVRDDSPYNIKDNVQYEGRQEDPYAQPVEPQVEPRTIPQEPQITQNEVNYPREEIPQQQEPEYIYPDHSFEPEPTSARLELEDRYEKYLDDLYFDEKEVPLGEQLAKDEEQYGSLTRKEYPTREEPPLKQTPPKTETPEEMEARIRAEILAEAKGEKKIKDKDTKDNIHNLNYQEEKEPMSAIDILLTIILILVILVVIYYLIYVFVLSAAYPTYMDALFALQNPQNVINNILTPQ